ncbi:hypothetical protein [Yoonia sp.]|uniref:hypothetical protein n=1 Tax=Yoonia sp. TaxID=2212373 RepID=UPI0019DF01F2|nr:hypothetical protein [Yoonia sp.]MBE0414046.1 hypothetical protein [Yoonia sp.]
MSRRFFKFTHLSRGDRALAMAYAVVMAVSAGLTVMILSVTAKPAASAASGTADSWAVLAGALSAGAAFYVLRGWFGRLGATGLLNAVAGSALVALSAASIAGLLVAPVVGLVMGPFVLVAAFWTYPVLGVAWLMVGTAAHLLISVRTRQSLRYDNRAVSQLSQLSQVSLYGRKLN